MNNNEATLSPFNTPLETGLRSLVLLVEGFPSQFDLRRLQFFDYLIVHSADAPNGPPSLHPATPHRSSELAVRRQLIEHGIRLMVSRGLIDRAFTVDGILYRASESAGPFLDCLKATYTVTLRQRANWVVSTFGKHTIDSLTEFFHDRLDRWGSEFEYKTLHLEDAE